MSKAFKDLVEYLTKNILSIPLLLLLLFGLLLFVYKRRKKKKKVKVL